MKSVSSARLGSVATFVCVLLSACGGGGGGGSSAAASAGTNGETALVRLVVEPPGANCASGGVAVHAGLDANGNATLDAAEVTAVSYVCNGTAGRTGATGATGNAGSVTLVQTLSEPAGPNCAYGGTRVAAGLDRNADGALDSAEITATSYVCNGVPGAAGPAGASGAQGPQGSNGKSTLVAMLNEPAGPNCANGGSKVVGGQDVNDNGVLDTSEITSVSFVCTGAAGANGAMGPAGAPGATGIPGITTLLQTAAEAPGPNCVSGGSKITSGLDLNADNILQPTEVTAVAYACNGAAGASGAAGTNGATGAAGHVSLVQTAAEPPGANCASGGVLVTSGLDVNDNATLDPAEVTSSRYVCNGAAGVAGAAGAAGAAGPQGAPGTAGTTGANGISVLLSMSSEPAGANCAFGGTKIVSGLDTNANGVLDTSEITAASYVCNGSAGSWVGVSQPSTQAVSNTGYLANAGTQVSITLPATPAVGDTVQVNGVGAGGWKIAQNTSDTIVTSGIPATQTAHSALWNWSVGAGYSSANEGAGVATSADGTKMVAVVKGGGIFVSTNGGSNWSQTSAPAAQQWSGVSSSADGSKLVAVVLGGSIYTSSDGGGTWTPSSSTNGQWTAVVSSTDGSKVFATKQNGYIYASSDAGATWTQTGSPSAAWTSIAASADGTRLIASYTFFATGGVYTSTDSGATWTTTALAAAYFTSVASSSDGSRLAACGQNGVIMLSSNGGTSWTASSSPNGDWWHVAMSANGAKVVGAYGHGGLVYTSIDGGTSWNSTGSPGQYWSALAVSGDGSTVVAAVDSNGNGGPIEIGRAIPITASSTTPGIAGSLSGSQYEALTLQYVGGGIWDVISYAGTTFHVE